MVSLLGSPSPRKRFIIFSPSKYSVTSVLNLTSNQLQRRRISARCKAVPNIKAGSFDVSSKYSAIACEVEIVVPSSSMKTGTVPAGLIERNSCRRSQMGSTASNAVIFFSPNTILIFLEKGSRGKCNRLGITLRVHKREFLNKG